jgi:hypothetical protein
MDKQTYLTKFTRAARWYLSPPEAAEVTADYQSMLAESGDRDRDPSIEFGQPDRAAWLLREPMSYLRWLAAFAGMALCLLVPELLLLTGRFPRPTYYLGALFVVGTAVALLSFRRRKTERSDLPRGLLPAILVLCAVLAAMCLTLLALSQGVWFSRLPLEQYGPFAQLLLSLTGTVACVLGLLGLIQARLSDQQWAALYIVSLTVLMICAIEMAQITRMDLDMSETRTLYTAFFCGVELC